jgi:Ca-activated chloride channel homolog
VPAVFHFRIPRPLPCIAVAALVCLALATNASAQQYYYYQNLGPNGFSQVDLVGIYLDQMNRQYAKSAKQKAQDQELIDSGAVSALDLEAPNNAIEQFDHASSLLKAQKSEEAVKYLQKAIKDYPKFVAAHVALGETYVDLEKRDLARNEFEEAAKLDSRFAGSFLNLGRLAMSMNDFATAQSELETAVSLRPKDPKILATLAFAENGNHQYLKVLATVESLHAIDHRGMADVHYVAASAAMSLKNYTVMERQLTILLSEDPTSAYAPVARKNLAILERNAAAQAAKASPLQPATLVASNTAATTFPNADRLKAELSGIGNESDCENCGKSEELNAAAGAPNSAAVSEATPALSRNPLGMWMIRTSVDDVAVFFSVSSHGHMIDDLQESEIQVRDNNKPPARVVQFSPGSKLPLRLGLLIDTSGSVNARFSFEKNAAAKFVEKVLNHSTDLAFVAGFATEATVVQDFSADPGELGKGIQKLSNGGGTALFDAVSYACRKLADYPDDERVARVLVIVSDGEDNSSRRSLKQSIDSAEWAGVTVYTVSTKEDHSDKTDADRVLEVLAERTGGEAMFPGDVLTLGRSFDKLRDLIRSRYFIDYKPADFHPDGSYRTISIIAQRNGKHLQVRARKGYHARHEINPN